MAVKILIKRQVPEHKENELKILLNELRSLTMNEPGYITGETLKRVDRPGEYLVISTWNSSEEWRKWVLSEARTEIQNQIDRLLGTETQYEIYAYE